MPNNKHSLKRFGDSMIACLGVIGAAPCALRCALCGNLSTTGGFLPEPLRESGLVRHQTRRQK
eukprot:9894686-Lingulodinium_polyedra.AAC.1